MTMFQRKAVKKEMGQQNEAADAHADGFLMKLIESKWTGAICLIAGLGIVALVLAGFL